MFDALDIFMYAVRSIFGLPLFQVGEYSLTIGGLIMGFVVVGGLLYVLFHRV